MIELQVDMAYYHDDLDGVVLVDEMCEMPERVFVPMKPEEGCTMTVSENIVVSTVSLLCGKCGSTLVMHNMPNYCPHCGAKVTGSKEA